jgi:hypothetical protein
VDLLDVVIAVVVPLAPIVAIVLIVRHGPLRNRWWRGENALGFASFVGLASFLAGFVGPMVLTPGGNQGPLLGIFITGPLGLLAGLVWGVVRAVRRGAG